jgi:hypothetical protein
MPDCSGWTVRVVKPVEAQVMTILLVDRNTKVVVYVMMQEPYLKIPQNIAYMIF